MVKIQIYNLEILLKGIKLDSTNHEINITKDDLFNSFGNETLTR